MATPYRADIVKSTISLLRFPMSVILSKCNEKGHLCNKFALLETRTKWVYRSML